MSEKKEKKKKTGRKMEFQKQIKTVKNKSINNLLNCCAPMRLYMRNRLASIVA